MPAVALHQGLKKRQLAKLLEEAAAIRAATEPEETTAKVKSASKKQDLEDWLDDLEELDDVPPAPPPPSPPPRMAGCPDGCADGFVAAGKPQVALAPAFRPISCGDS